MEDDQRTRVRSRRQNGPAAGVKKLAHHMARAADPLQLAAEPLEDDDAAVERSRSHPRRRTGHPMSGERYDVAIVGYGPTGMILASLLGSRGWRVAVLERYPDLFNLPRAACFDDEIMRLFQKLGLVEEVMPGVVAQPDYEWVNADGETLMHLHYDDPAPGGWAALYMMYQPHIEAVLDRRCKSLPAVDVMQGVTVCEVDPGEDAVTLSGVRACGEPISLSARYVVGADGGASFVRRRLGIESSDYNFQENWLVCDFEKQGELEHVPSFRQVCDPVQPISIVRIGPHHHRFSFMLESEVTGAQATDPAGVWRRVAAYLVPQDAELIRVANYVFRSRIADRWRDGRVLLAGDAAHEMPPFLAQGMCSGMRDANNLAWKLDFILGGQASPELLDTYQPERESHVRFITEKAIELGRVQTLRDPAAVRARDERLIAAHRAHQAPEKLRWQPLAAGLRADGQAARSAGEFFPQARVRGRASEALFDDLAGPGPCLLLRSADGIPSGVSEKLAAGLASLGGRVVALGPATHNQGSGGPEATVVVQDISGTYGDWFDAHRCEAVLVRTDWYVYGTAARAPESVALVDGLLAGLRGGLADPTAYDRDVLGRQG
jgi:2-polyprenyl-6-methoxyphenol hydroxylase-like FAD-dependent oxidoreductase